MLPAEIANSTVLRLRGTKSQDSWNDSATDWSSPGTLIVGNCSVQPLPGDELTLGRESVVSRWTFLSGQAGADIRSSDRIRYDGVDYDIDGSVQKFTDTTGNGLDHLVAILRRVEG